MGAISQEGCDLAGRAGKRRNYAETLELSEFHRVASRVRELLGATGAEE